MKKKGGRWREMETYSWGSQGLQQAVAQKMVMEIPHFVSVVFISSISTERDLLTLVVILN